MDATLALFILGGFGVAIALVVLGRLSYEKPYFRACMQLLPEKWRRIYNAAVKAAQNQALAPAMTPYDVHVARIESVVNDRIDLLRAHFEAVRDDYIDIHDNTDALVVGVGAADILTMLRWRETRKSFTYLGIPLYQWSKKCTSMTTLSDPAVHNVPRLETTPGSNGERLAFVYHFAEEVQ